MSNLGNIFLTRDDLNSLSAPKNRLEPQYCPGKKNCRASVIQNRSFE